MLIKYYIVDVIVVPVEFPGRAYFGIIIDLFHEISKEDFECFLQHKSNKLLRETRQKVSENFLRLL